MRKNWLGVALVILLVTSFGAWGKGSAEAILEGLERAAQAQAGNQQEVQVLDVDTSQEQQMGDGNEYVSRVFTCNLGDLERRISIEYPGPDAGYACRVLYDTEKGADIPWHARSEKAYCEPHGMGLVKKHLDRGWNCIEN